LIISTNEETPANQIAQPAISEKKENFDKLTIQSVKSFNPFNLRFKQKSGQEMSKNSGLYH